MKANRKNDKLSAHQKAMQVLRRIDYDFRSFTMQDFIRRIEQVTGRSILFIPYDMPEGHFGAWISDDEDANEFIFHRNDVPELHQVHIQLHELAHFLCGHSTLHVDSQSINELLGGNAKVAFREIKHQTTPTEDAEQEAELLASMIQEKVIRASRLNQLTCVVSNDPKVSQYLQTLGIT